MATTPRNRDKKDGEIKESSFIFEKRNYKVMLIGFIVIAIGFLLMSGGGSKDPEVFNPEIFNWRRIRLAPALVLLGFGIEIYAILLKPKETQE